MKPVAALALALSLAACAAGAAPPSAPSPVAKPAPKPPKPVPPEAEFVAKLVREALVKKLPDPLTTSNQNWGRQKAVTVVHRRREGLRFWTEPVQEFHNDGLWRRVEVRVPDPAKLSVAITELTYPEDGKVLATVAVACERVDVKVEQQLWLNDRRLYGGETRAHCAAALALKVAVATRTEYKKGALFPIPEVTLQVRATEAQLYYDELIVDHTAGLDGEAAKSVGEALLRLVKVVKPDLESDLLEKANAAVVKAAGTREIKLALDKVLAGKK
ncbi:hypothetical protein [Gemmata sp.]|uniref:hypothetical protein n=1 Tax=Gemmata sp. TaxID=1914242 RepID=UPI003F6F6327